MYRISFIRSQTILLLPYILLKCILLLLMMHSRSYKLTILCTIVLLVAYIGLFAPSAIPRHSLAAYSQNQRLGQSTTGTKQFSINQFANDTIGLLDTLKIRRADILGFSIGSYIAQEIALKNPNRVNSLILYASSCGGKNAVPPRPQVLQAVSAITNTSLSAQQKIDRITSTLFPSEWFKANPNYQSYIPNSKEPVSFEIIQRQQQATVSWFSMGTCNTLSKITQPTLAIVGTDDMWTPAANSLMIAEKIPGASVIQIKGAGHGLMYQFPDKFSKVVSTFLQIAS